jgi:DNA recombination protein RmuC
MSSSVIITGIICLLSGVIITWIICKLIFDKNFVPIADYDSISKDLQEYKTQKAVLDTELNNIRLESSRNAGLVESKTLEAQKLLAQLTESNTKRENLEKDIANNKEQYQKLQSEVSGKQFALQKTEADVSRLNAELRFKQEKLDSQKQEIENIGQKFETEFKLLAGKILDEKTKDFSQKQESGLDAILKPLKEQIQTFKTEFETKYKTESDDRISLREQVKQMMDLNKTLSEQANNLTLALSNNVKHQGDWGEGILESILEYAGLQKDIQYFVQKRTQNNEGELIQPDIVVKYPDERAIIIDSKVSLLHHTRYCAAKDAEEQGLHLNQLVNSLKLHVDGLSKKDYQAITDALDFVLMFVPNEAAYITAMQAEHELWQYAYNKRILIISPTNLIPAMKLIADLWQKNSVGKNALEIADKAGKVYDKLCGFVENFEKIGTQIEKAQATWIDARKQLNKGKGNLLSQAEQIKLLKVKTAKQLPKKLVEEALLEDGIDLEETNGDGHSGGEIENTEDPE